MFVGSILLFFWLRGNFDLISEPVQSKITNLFGRRLDLRASDFAYVTRYRRARRMYVSLFMTFYLVLSMLGLAVATKSGLLSETFARVYPDAASFPLILALAIQTGSPMLPHVLSIDSQLRAWLHELIAIPTEVEDILFQHYNDIDIFENEINRKTMNEEGPELRKQFAIERNSYVLDKAISLIAGLKSLPSSIFRDLSQGKYERLLSNILFVEQKAKALKLDCVDNPETLTNSAEFSGVLRSTLLSVACFVSSTDPARRAKLLEDLGLNQGGLGFRLNWHEIIASQLVVLFVSLLLFTAFGGPIGHHFAAAFSMPALPQHLLDVLYSWIVPDGVPLLLSYCLLFAVFSPKPGGAPTGAATSSEPLSPSESFYTKLITAFVIVYACALGARMLWQFLVVSNSSPPFIESVVLTLGSVGTAAIASICQRNILSARSQLNLRLRRMFLCTIWAVSGCIIWNAVIGQIYLQGFPEKFSEQNASSGYLLMSITFPLYCLASILLGTFLGTIRPLAWRGSLSPVGFVRSKHQAPNSNPI
jgi:hypothetical protein